MAPGCSTVVDTVAAVFGPGDVGGEVDAHVVYRLRPDCPALLARSISHGYTVLTPLGSPDVEGVPELLGASIEETGVFEGPVRTGEVLFRYVPPSASETWTAGPVDVVAEVDAVRLDLDEARGHDAASRAGPSPCPSPRTRPSRASPAPASRPLSDLDRPPRYDAGDPSAYVDDMLARVGDRDPLALLAAAPDRLADAVAHLSDNDARRAPEPGAWSVLQILRHLADSEIVYGYRLRLIVASGEDRPADSGLRPRRLGRHAPLPPRDRRRRAGRLSPPAAG